MNDEQATDSTSSRIEDLESKVLELLDEKDRPWYKVFTNHIALAAFVLSFVATVLTFLKESIEEKQAMRESLATHINFLMELPVKSAELQSRLASSPNVLYQATSSLNSLAVIRGKLAADIMKDLGVETFSSTLLTALSFSLLNSAQYSESELFADFAGNVAKTDYEKLAVQRLKGKIYFTKGTVGEARVCYGAVDELIRSVYSESEYYMNISLCELFLDWAIIEKMYDADRAKVYYQKSTEYVDAMHDSPAKDQMSRLVASHRF